MVEALVPREGKETERKAESGARMQELAEAAVGKRRLERLGTGATVKGEAARYLRGSLSRRDQKDLFGRDSTPIP